jgi:hypothetical protein
MPTFEIICLASSDKYGGRCIAGLKTDGSGWLRPVSMLPEGTLQPENYMLETGCEPKIFDVLEIECSGCRPECYQPENWIISSKKWRLVGFPSHQKLVDILRPELDKNAMSEGLFGNVFDKVDYELLMQNPVQHSLAYVKPEHITWFVQEYGGKKKYGACFMLNKISYNLKITDPDWKSRMDKAQVPRGYYSSLQVISLLNLVDFKPEEFRFTLSLGEPFVPNNSMQKSCFKLIAAVINVAPIIKQSN